MKWVFFIFFLLNWRSFYSRVHRWNRLISIRWFTVRFTSIFVSHEKRRKKILLNAYLFVRRDSTAINLDEYLVKSKTIWKEEKKRENEKIEHKVPSDYWVWEQTAGYIHTLLYFSYLKYNTFAQTIRSFHIRHEVYLLWNHCRQTFQINGNDFHIFVCLNYYCSQIEGKKWLIYTFHIWNHKNKASSSSSPPRFLMFFMSSSRILSNCNLQHFYFAICISENFSIEVLFNSKNHWQ